MGAADAGGERGAGALRVLVTGIGGFVGRYLAALLLTDGHRVSGLARRLPEGLPDGLSVGLADLADATWLILMKPEFQLLQ